MNQRRSIDRLIHKNLETIAQLEQELYNKFTPLERLVHRITSVIGRLYVLLLHVVLIMAWIVMNTPPLHPPFMDAPVDPWPYAGLILFLGSEAIILTLLVLTTQRIMQQLSNHRAHLTLQIQLLNEQETTKVLEIVTRLEQRLGGSGIKDDAVAAMTQHTRPEDVSDAIEQTIKEDHIEKN